MFAQTHITNQKNITNFFRVTTPTPSSKRENSDLKVTPKKVPHLPCGKQIVRDEKVPPVTAPAEIFIVEDSRPDSIPEKREAETCDISAHDIQSVIEIPSDEIPTSVVETILTADPIITTFSPQESPIVVEISEPTTQIEAQKKRSRKKTQKYSDDQPTAEYTTSLESHPPMSSALTERLQNSRQKAHSLLQSLVSDHRSHSTYHSLTNHSSLREALKGSRETEFLSISEELNDILGGTDDSEEIFTAFMDSFKTKVKRFIQLYVQDHVAPLTDIYSALKVDFDILRGKVFQSDYCHKEKIITELNSYDTVEYLKEVARRVSYGYRSPTEIKETSHFDDESSIALWRWEVCFRSNNSHFRCSWWFFLKTFLMVKK